MSQPYLAKGGHQVNFIHQAGQWWACVNEHLPIGFTRRIDLPVYCEPGLCVAEVDQHDQTWHKHRLHVCFPEKAPDQRGYVYVGSMGLKGGGDGWSYAQAYAYAERYQRFREDLEKSIQQDCDELNRLQDAKADPAVIIAKAEAIKRQVQAAISSVEQYSTRQSKEGVLAGLREAQQKLDEVIRDFTKIQNYQAFISEINQEAQRAGAPLNRLLEEDADPAAIIEAATSLKQKAEETIVRVENYATKQNKEQSLKNLEKAKNDLEEIIDKQSYQAFISEINQELERAGAPLNRLLEEDADPAAIIEAATSLKQKAEETIVRVENYATKQNKEQSLKSLEEAKNKLEEIIDKQSYQAFISEINQELERAGAPLNKLLEEDANPAAIIAEATSFKQKVAQIIVRVENYETRQNKEQSLKNLEEAKNKLEEIIDEQSYQAFISEINQELERERAPLNSLLAAAAPAAIIEAATSFKQKVAQIIVRVENYETRQNKEQSLKNLEEAKNKLEEILEKNRARLNSAIDKPEPLTLAHAGPVAVGSGLWQYTKAAVRATWAGVKTVGKTVWHVAKPVGKAIWHVAKPVGKAIWNILALGGAAVKATWAGVKAVGSSLWQRTKAAVRATWAGVKTVGKTVWHIAKPVGKWL